MRCMLCSQLCGTMMAMTGRTATARLSFTQRILSQSRVPYANALCSNLHTRTETQNLPTKSKMSSSQCSGGRGHSSWAGDLNRVARPDEVNYALIQDMGSGYTRKTVEIAAIGTTYNMVYGEWVATGMEGMDCPVVLCLHGTPATEGAFRPIGSRIAKHGYRVLAVNFPGMGYTEVDPERKYQFNTEHKAELVKAFISALQIERVAMVIGHSLGSHIVGELAADPALEGVIQSACFMAGTGIQPHRLYSQVNQPTLAHIIFKLMYLPVIGPLVTRVVAWLVYRMGFRGKTPEAHALCLIEVTFMNFAKYTRHLLRITEKQLPVLILYAADDAVVEKERIEENIAVMGIPESSCKLYDAEGMSQHTFQAGSLRRAVCFEGGTHRIQFTSPDQTTHEVVSLLEAMNIR